MIIDCFPYFNEKEILEFRIKLLKNNVDKFIILEANRTHQGDIKSFTCKNTLKELGLDNEKIQVVEVDLSWADDEEDSWVRERAQRNEVFKYVKNNDYCIISDCDEIINPERISDVISILDNNPDTIVMLPMYFLLYRGDIVSSCTWDVPYVTKGSMIKNTTPSYYRERMATISNIQDFGFKVYYLQHEDGTLNGWHFSWMGGNMRCKIKNESMATHSHFNEMVKSTIMSFEPKIGGNDLFNREGSVLLEYDTSLLPKLIWEMTNFKNFILPNK